LGIELISSFCGQRNRENFCKTEGESQIAPLLPFNAQGAFLYRRRFIQNEHFPLGLSQAGLVESSLYCFVIHLAGYYITENSTNYDSFFY
jgi:hypothetical protein